MKKIYLLSIFILLSVIHVTSQSSCDIDKVVYVKKNIATLSTRQIEHFLLCINSNCFNNIEYSEYCNEIIFLLLEMRTECILQIIEQNPNISIKDIKTMIENPIDDEIDFMKIYLSIKNIGKYKYASEEILKSLAIAKSKYAH